MSQSSVHLLCTICLVLISYLMGKKRGSVVFADGGALLAIESGDCVGRELDAAAYVDSLNPQKPL